MRNPKIILAVLLVLLLCTKVVRSEEADPQHAEIKNIISEKIEEGPYTALLVGVVNPKGEVFYSGGRIKVGPLTIFEIGSLTKIFTNLLLAAALERGEVKPDQTVQSLLPAGVVIASPEGKSLTLMDLATHGAGLTRMPSNWDPADQDQPYAHYHAADLYQYLALDQTIGRGKGKFQYSNTGTGLLGHLLALRAGKSYAELVQERICRPLGLKDTAVNLTQRQRTRLARGFSPAGQRVPAWEFSVLAGCGALKSTAHDMLKFLSACLGFKKTPLDKALKETLEPRGPGPSPQVKIGLGWLQLGQQGIYVHDGGTAGHRGFIGLCPKEKRGVVVLANTSVDVSDIGLHILDKRFPIRAMPKGVKLSQGQMVALTGKYRTKSEIAGADGIDITISQGPKGLLYRQREEKPTTILALSPTEFMFPTAPDSKLFFIIGKGGKAEKLVIDAGGMEIQALRLK